jgi:hypothetical protein
MVVNETDLPDEAVMTYVEEHASMLGVNQSSQMTSFQGSGGSLLARARFKVPRTIQDEMMLARDLAEKDDDVGATIGSMTALACGEGWRHSHVDEVTVAAFDKIAREMNLYRVLQEMYRELLITASITSVHAFMSKPLQFQPQGSDRQRTRNIIMPMVGVLPGEQVRVLDNDMFATGTLAYAPLTGSQEVWLREFFSPQTTAARKAEMRREDPVLTTLLVREVRVNTDAPTYIESTDAAQGGTLYLLNPTMVHRSTFPKGAARYARPLLTRNFALVEAKRMLNIMDYALLQGGANFLVVAKKGTDQRPAQPAEISNLREQLRRSGSTGAIIGDHRLSIEVITPKLDEMLNAEKRKLLGRKIAMAMLRLPEFSEGDTGGGGQSVLTDTEILSRVVASDRGILKRHVENGIYEEIEERNTASFQTGAADLWFPKIVLQGLQFFTDMVLKLRDRGDISRHSAVAAAGYDYDAEVAERKREKSDDRTMTPAMGTVPFSSASGGPQDNGGGRPPGASSANGAPGSQPPGTSKDPAHPTKVIQRNAGETVRAFVEGEVTYRAGELTQAILEEYADASQGRLSAFERRAIEEIANDTWPDECFMEGPITIVPVNPGEIIDEIKAIRLASGLSMLVGRNTEDAIMARAFCFRTPEFSSTGAQETAFKWGFDVGPVKREPVPA